jgi:anti-sigma B factor antagonist
MPLPSDTPVQVEQIGDVVVVRFTSETILDQAATDNISAQLMPLVDKGQPRLILNFSTVTFLASSFLGKLFSLLKKVEAAKGRVAFCVLNPDLREVFRIVHLDRRLNIYHDEEEALKSFAEQGPAPADQK